MKELIKNYIALFALVFLFYGAYCYSPVSLMLVAVTVPISFSLFYTLFLKK